jgi:hypothetical protein
MKLQLGGIRAGMKSLWAYGRPGSTLVGMVGCVADCVPTVSLTQTTSDPCLERPCLERAILQITV